MMARALRFAWLRVRREPGRTALAVLGVTAIGALLFDMLLLSNGLLESFRDRLERSGFDVRVMGSDAVVAGPPIPRASQVVAALRGLPAVGAVQRVTLGSADVDGREAARHVTIVGVELGAPVPWTIAAGRAPAETDAPAGVVINRNMARQFGLDPGALVALRGRCGASVRLPAPVRVVAIADFQNDAANALTVAMAGRALAALCGGGADEADMLLVTARAGAGGPEAAAAEIRRVAPSLYVVTNEQLVDRFGRIEFSYFRQLSSVLTTVTLFFGLLLVAVLLTVSVNQRLGEIAALRALGLSRARVMAGVFSESLLLVGIGGAAAVPLGAVLSLWLDGILRALPGIPADAHFFVFTPRALLLHAALMAAGAACAAIYPMRLVAALPVAATLRREVGA